MKITLYIFSILLYSHISIADSNSEIIVKTQVNYNKSISLIIEVTNTTNHPIYFDRDFLNRYNLLLSIKRLQPFDYNLK